MPRSEGRWVDSVFSSEFSNKNSRRAEREFQLSATSTKLGRKRKSRTALKDCRRHQTAVNLRREAKEALLSSESIAALFPLQAQNKREHIATMPEEEGCCLFL